MLRPSTALVTLRSTRSAQDDTLGLRSLRRASYASPRFAQDDTVWGPLKRPAKLDLLSKQRLYRRSFVPRAVMIKATVSAITASTLTTPSETSSGTSPLPVNECRNASIM